MPVFYGFMISFYVDSLPVRNNTIISFLFPSVLSPRSLQGLNISYRSTHPQKYSWNWQIVSKILGKKQKMPEKQPTKYKI